MTSLEQAEAARETAWAEYNAIQRAIPGCEHVQAWRDSIEQARATHQAAIRACARARREQVRAAAEPAPAVAPVVPEPVAVLDGQEVLFELGEVA